MSRLILCADDFALTPGTSRVIAELARSGKLNATGCMVARPGWKTDAALLRDLPAGFQVGLHLVLTEDAPLKPMPRLAPDGRLPGINALGSAARAGALPLDEIAGEVAAQFDRFVAVLGRPPAFVDGHQHAHHHPGIREIVLDATAARAPGAWVRNCADQVAAMLARPFRGKALASAFHSRGLAKAAAARGLACNEGFAGHYGFSGDYAALFPRFLARPGATHLVMCHPGTAEPGDVIGSARVVEAAALRRLDVADVAARHGLAFAA